MRKDQKMMKRDRNLDTVKWVASIMMIFAHSHGYGKTFDNWLTLIFYQAGLLAPALFLTATGASITYQIKNRPRILIFFSYFLLFVVSFANVGLRLQHKDILSFEDGNIYTSIALSGILAVLIAGRENMFIALLPLIIYFLLKPFLGNTHSMLYGGLFSIAPWSTFTLTGLYIIKHKQLTFWTLVLLLLIFFFFYLTDDTSLPGDYEFPFYLVIGLIFYLSILMIAPLITKKRYLFGSINFIARNSLLFYVIHRLIIIYLPLKLAAPLVWIILFVSSITLMKLLIRINFSYLFKFSSSIYFWLILILIMLIPYFFPFDIIIQRLLMFLVLIIHSLNYRNFSKISFLKKIL